jgi:hypothetical protein
MKVILTAGLCASILAHATLAHAEANGAKAPTLKETLETAGLFIGGFIDTSYTYLSGAGVFTSGIPNRVFDREHNSFNLNLVDITVAYQPEEGFGGFVQLDFGSDANIFAAVGTGTDDEFDVQEAFVQYAYAPFTAVGASS